MKPVSTIALSGMQAARVQLDVASHNIANVQTPNFRRQTVAQQAQPEGGVTTTVSLVNTPGPDFAGDVVDQLGAGYAFVANLKTIETDQQMTGTLLDITA